jgi:succinate dehydrogenase / fumarate reductase flavoprotein subunit
MSTSVNETIPSDALIDGHYRIGSPIADTKAPGGPIEPGEPPQVEVLVVGTGLAGARPPRPSASWATTSRPSATRTPPAAPTRSPPRAASTPRRTTGTTATRIHRLFYDTVKGGDYRSARPTSTASPRSACTSSTSASPRACPSPASTAACSTTAPSAAPGGPHLLRPRPDRPAAPARRLPGAACARSSRARSRCFARTRCSTSSSSTARPRHRGRNLVTGRSRRTSADAVVLATGGYGNVFFLSTNAMGCNVTARGAPPRGALLRNPCYTQIHPTCIPVMGTTSPSSR